MAAESLKRRIFPFINYSLTLEEQTNIIKSILIDPTPFIPRRFTVGQKGKSPNKLSIINQTNFVNNNGRISMNDRKYSYYPAHLNNINNFTGNNQNYTNNYRKNYHHNQNNKQPNSDNDLINHCYSFNSINNSKFQQINHPNQMYFYHNYHNMNQNKTVNYNNFNYMQNYFNYMNQYNLVNNLVKNSIQNSTVNNYDSNIRKSNSRNKKRLSINKFDLSNNDNNILVNNDISNNIKPISNNLTKNGSLYSENIKTKRSPSLKKLDINNADFYLNLTNAKNNLNNSSMINNPNNSTTMNTSEVEMENETNKTNVNLFEKLNNKKNSKMNMNLSIVNEKHEHENNLNHKELGSDVKKENREKYYYKSYSDLNRHSLINYNNANNFQNRNSINLNSNNIQGNNNFSAVNFTPISTKNYPNHHGSISSLNLNLNYSNIINEKKDSILTNDAFIRNSIMQNMHMNTRNNSNLNTYNENQANSSYFDNYYEESSYFEERKKSKNIKNQKKQSFFDTQNIKNKTKYIEINTNTNSNTITNNANEKTDLVETPTKPIKYYHRLSKMSSLNDNNLFSNKKLSFLSYGDEFNPIAEFNKNIKIAPNQSRKSSLNFLSMLKMQDLSKFRNSVFSIENDLGILKEYENNTERADKLNFQYENNDIISVYFHMNYLKQFEFPDEFKDANFIQEIMTKEVKGNIEKMKEKKLIIKNKGNSVFLKTKNLRYRSKN